MGVKEGGGRRAAMEEVIGTTIVYEGRRETEVRRVDDEKRDSSEHEQPGRQRGELSEQNACGRLYKYRQAKTIAGGGR